MDRLLENFLAYAEGRRTRVLALAAALTVLIAFVDWRYLSTISIGYLYLFPLLMVASQLRPWQAVAASAVCGLLREQFNPIAWTSGADGRILTAAAGFTLATAMVAMLDRKRRQLLEQIAAREEQIRLREAAEQQVRVLVETSPLGIVIMDAEGTVLLHNRSVEELLGYAPQGSDIRPYIPILSRVLDTPGNAPMLHTTIECTARRAGGEVFLAHIWLSTYLAEGGKRLAAVIWDASEDLRQQEDSGLNAMLATSRVVIGAMAHEVRNLAAAAATAHRSLGSVDGVESSEPYRALSAILQGLSVISTSGLAMAARSEAEVADIGTVLAEARIVVEASMRESGGEVEWLVTGPLPSVRASQHSLLQVFLNLARNAETALRNTEAACLTVEAAVDHGTVVVRFRDNGPGVKSPGDLFRPFHSTSSAGLGLYVSRAMVRSFGGDLDYEPQPVGSCFTVHLLPAEDN